ncbi:MAG: OmpH family outer membrane protein [Planctomycetota bacterium]
MAKRMVPLLIVIVLFALAWGAEQAGGPPLLLVQVQRVVEGCDEAKDSVAELRREKAQTEKAFTERIRKLKEQADELKKTQLNDRDETFLSALYELEFERGKLKAEWARKLIEFSDRELRVLKAILQDVKSAAEEVMVQRGAEIVFASRLDQVNVTREQDLAQEYVSRRVLAWRDPKADVTQDVLDLLNKWYAQRKKPGGGRADRTSGDAAKPPAKKEGE